MNYKKSYPLPKNTQFNKNQCESDVLPRYDQPTHVLNINQRHIVGLKKLDYTFKIPCLPSQIAKWNFFIFQKRDTPKFHIYQETELSYNFGNRTWRAKKEKELTLKKLLIISEMELSSPKLKKQFIF